MSHYEAVQYLAVILIAVGIGITQLPLRCNHGCPECEYEARQKRREQIAANHYAHVRPHPECARCDENR